MEQLKYYKRQCTRCEEWFNAETKLCKICNKCNKNICKNTMEKQRERQQFEDRMIFGNSYEEIASDGTRKRIDPSKQMFGTKDADLCHFCGKGYLEGEHHQCDSEKIGLRADDYKMTMGGNTDYYQDFEGEFTMGEEDCPSISSAPEENNITFQTINVPEPIIELRENGDILIKGKFIENDKEVVDAMREIIAGTRIV